MILTDLTPMFPILGSVIIIYLLGYFFDLRRKSRKSPLTRQLLRSPGETLRIQLNDLSYDMVFYMMMLVSIPLVLNSVYLFQNSRDRKLDPYCFAILCCVLLIFVIFKVLRLSKQRDNLMLGLDCELAVGQELNHLMLEGYRVYHDFPGEQFNIDHVVVGPKGVFAVETKGRMKRRDKGGEAAVTVRYDGHALLFPDWTEQAPVDQAKAQALWLSKWLSTAVGEQVSARPVLAIPGWFSLNKAHDGLLLFSGKNPLPMLNSTDGKLNSQQITRIAHQVEERCRNVKPFAYSKKAKI